MSATWFSSTGSRLTRTFVQGILSFGCLIPGVFAEYERRGGTRAVRAKSDTVSLLLAMALLVAGEMGAAESPAAWIDWKEVSQPWRVVNGRTNYVPRAEDWYNLRGRVIQGNKGFALVTGNVDRDGRGWQDITFAVKNLPVKVIDDDKLPPLLTAKYVGEIEYTTVLGAKKTIRSFDCGIPCAPPVSEESFQEWASMNLVSPEKAALRAKIEANRLKFTMEQASNGVASAQYELGLRHLEGRGVEKSDALAKMWFVKAASKGHAPAKTALAGLSQLAK